MPTPEHVKAFSSKTGLWYDTWDDLVEVEANGYIVTAILEEDAPAKTLFTASVGPFPTQKDANNARARMRTSFKRSAREGNSLSRLIKITVKPLWKEVF